MTRTRFAPSPTGHLHLGHAYAAWVAWREARQAGGNYLLRWEDIDPARCRPEYEASILEDLHWLGLAPDEKPVRQSERLGIYAESLRRLEEEELLYPCFCTRKEILAEIAESGRAPQGPEGPIYPGTCRDSSAEERRDRLVAGEPCALRLRMDEACRRTGPLMWLDRRRGEQRANPESFGDVVLARKDIPTSYHLAVTLDDAAQGITLVTRGEDLFQASSVHRLLQALLGLPVPEWLHHSLVRDEQGERLAKRDAKHSLEAMRESGWDVGRVWTQLGVPVEERPPV